LKPRQVILVIFAAAFAVGVVFAQSHVVEKKTVPFESLKHYIECELFQPDYMVADCNYHSIISASDGKIYFSLGTHNTDYPCRFYSFDPSGKKITLLGELDEWVGEDARKQYSQGKIHTPLFEYKEKIWFATHTSFYQGGLPGTKYHGKLPFMGGHFMNYDIRTGRFTDLARVLPGEGIISMTMDKKNEILYGLTWPSGLLVSYEIKSKDLRCWGAVQNRGEWGHHPWEWDRICRTLGIDPDGYVYGSTMDGLIWRYDRNALRRVSYIKGLDLSKLPFSQSAVETNKGDFQNNWRTIEWNPATNSFWGLHFECTTLFEFDPKDNYVRAVAELRPAAYQGMPRNPEVSQLGFMIGPKNTIFYLAHGPAVELKGRKPVQSGLYLLTYEIDKGKLTDHGPILSRDKRRVFFSESITIGSDDHIYSVAWVEVTDPKRLATLKAARASGAAAETEKSVYEMMLIRLPRWSEFVK